MLPLHAAMIRHLPQALASRKCRSSMTSKPSRWWSCRASGLTVANPLITVLAESTGVAANGCPTRAEPRPLPRSDGLTPDARGNAYHRRQRAIPTAVPRQPDSPAPSANARCRNPFALPIPAITNT
jgi:hypothetical protein